jgi:hypothetical protein
LFGESENARIFEIIARVQSSGKEISVSNLFDEIGSNGLRDRLSEIAFMEQSFADWETVFEDCMKRFKKINIKKRLDELKGLIIEADRESDRKKLELLTREFHKLEAEV